MEIDDHIYIVSLPQRWVNAKGYFFNIKPSLTALPKPVLFKYHIAYPLVHTHSPFTKIHTQLFSKFPIVRNASFF